MVALYAELDEKADHLRRADELKSKFLSNMSHEFRSPLNSILASERILLDRADGDLTGEQDQQVGYIRRAAQDLLELVNDLLDLAKVEAGKVEAKPIEFEVANLFAALRGMLRPLLLNQSVDLTFEDAPHIPPLYSDEGKISQILRNFISNALKFTEKGEVRVAATLVGDDEIEFSVADTGIGIAPEHQELIFQDFVQLDHPIQRNYKGTGLGLPLSRKLATFLGGSVNVESRLGAGSTFSVRIPMRYRDSAEDHIPAPAERTPDSASELVLFIEDSAEMLTAYRSYLKGSGFQPVTASTTREAEDILERVQPRAIVLDIVLRSEDTWGFLVKLKEDPQTRNIPVLVASTIEDQPKAFHLGVSAYIIKPFERADLLGKLRDLTGVPAMGRVLIIDDNELDRYLLKQHLKKLPVAITEATSGPDGIRQVLNGAPDLIFLDLTMPEMNGFEVIEKLKSVQASKDIPVAIITSRVLKDRERARLMENAIAIVSKEDLRDQAAGSILPNILREAGLSAATAGTSR